MYSPIYERLQTAPDQHVGQFYEFIQITRDKMDIMLCPFPLSACDSNLLRCWWNTPFNLVPNGLKTHLIQTKVGRNRGGYVPCQ